MKRSFLTSRQSGFILSLTLVLLGSILILAIAGAGLIVTQKRAISRQLNDAQAFHAAEAGSELAFALLSSGACEPKELLSHGAMVQTLTDPETESVAGVFSVTFAASPANALQASATGAPSASSNACHQITLEITETSVAGVYKRTWQDNGSVVCGAALKQAATLPDCASKSAPG